MTLRDFLAALRRSFWIPVTTVVVCLAIAGIYLATTTKEYTAQAEVFVAAGTDVGQSQDQVNLSTFIANRVSSYSRLATTDAVVQPVIQQLGLTVTPSDLSKKVSASVPLNTAFIEVSAKDESAEQAAKIANAAAAQLVTSVTTLESAKGTAASSPVKLSVVQTATPPSSASSPLVLLDLLLALVIGLALGVIGVLIRGSGNGNNRQPSHAAVSDSGGAPDPTETLFSSTAGRISGQP